MLQIYSAYLTGNANKIQKFRVRDSQNECPDFDELFLMISSTNKSHKLDPEIICNEENRSMFRTFSYTHSDRL